MSERKSPGDLMSLLEAQGIRFPTVDADLPKNPASVADVHGTTVIAVKFDQGVLNVADRRATAGNAIFYEEAEKILKLDDETLIAIAGSYATASEAVRFLQHSFKYYARSQLQEMSLEGKLHEVSRVLGRALPGALQGIGGFLPIVSAFDREKREGRIFFYDAMGARFESREFGAAGSGAERIRGAFEYIVRIKRPFRQMKLEEALREALLLLEIAASLDTATSGIRQRLPSAKTVTADGVQELSEDLLRALQRELLAL
ncbi:MAG: proteasome subunit alpha [Candidatus Bipolaricaulota bacterium]|nr:proteasome subunit alpha [Candidatus Bipolaricaulota bacterium]MDW8141003.1 proteasome subunit alpha [Candidatus Bipolaricaulota bacterium]